MADLSGNNEGDVVSTSDTPVQNGISKNISDVQIIPIQQQKDISETAEDDNMCSCNHQEMHVISVYEDVDDASDTVKDQSIASNSSSVMESGISKSVLNDTPCVEENQEVSSNTREEESASSCSFSIEDIGLTAEEELETQRLIALAETGDILENKTYIRNKIKSTEEDTVIESFRHADSDEELRVKNLLSSYRERLLKKMNENIDFNKTNDNDNIQNISSSVDMKPNERETKESRKINWEVTEEDLCLESTLRERDDCFMDKQEYIKKESHRRTHNRTYNFDGSRSYTKLPMNDKRGEYFIDRKLVPISIYQEGLMNSRWNPTQVVFEICSQCYWPPPEFTELSYSVSEGFLCGVRVKGRHFVPKEKGQTKRLAKHLASTQFLRFLGFRFDYEKRKGADVDVFQDSIHKGNVDVTVTKCRYTVEVSDLRHSIRGNGSRRKEEKNGETSKYSRIEGNSKNFDEISDERVSTRKSHFTNRSSDTSNYKERTNRPHLRMDDEKYLYSSSRHSGPTRRNRTSGIILSNCSSVTTRHTSKTSNYESRRTYRKTSSLDKHASDLWEDDCIPISSKSLHRCIFDKDGVRKLSPDTSRAWLEAFKATIH